MEKIERQKNDTRSRDNAKFLCDFNTNGRWPSQRPF